MEDNADIPVPLDFLGQEIAVGDHVLASQGHELAIYKVLKITPKMVRVAKITAKSKQAKKGALRYSKELFKIDETLVTYFLIKQ